MNNEQYEQWKALVYRVVNRHFGRATRSHHRYASIDHEDLVQEGFLALARALKRYKEEYKNSKLRYLYSAVYRDVLYYVDKNVSPVSTGHWRQKKWRPPEDFGKLVKAFECRNMSYYGGIDGLPFESSIPDDNPEESSDTVIQGAWVEHCMGLLWSALPPRHMHALLTFFETGSKTAVAQDLGVSRERARVIIKKALAKAAVILEPQEQNSDPVEAQKYRGKWNSR